eukprot:CAMPEP_0195300208 /NCGR_PEP_ID=MMETSP0707-20130614/26956_1 /TAXON_ID=33640 /ORGANISM="Asterionellopsis glacialis, Strain CCMP134" /LENGTH=457 /DNA_ID=CAMNT_0040362837 /DNA_START=159 /DNA_END=1532 /DNA_ORIENTATION=+
MESFGAGGGGQRSDGEMSINGRLESVHLSTDHSNATAHSGATTRHNQHGRGPNQRPWDIVRNAGPPANPIAFPKPSFARGQRADVLVYDERTQQHYTAQNVLFCDYSSGDGDEGLSRVERAYRKIPEKPTIDTIMGHVEICNVLRRSGSDRMSDADDSDTDDDGESEDIVFEMTDQLVAVKVNYCDRMDRMRNRHAEDPLKEVAAMQLIGNSHPNVLGCLEVLFDGTHLNVVLPYCGSGDLFAFLQETRSSNPGMPGLPEPQARFMFRQVLQGMRHLQSRGVCHRDLSPENIMMEKDCSLIIDMGMCLRIPYSNPGNPPEVVTDITQGSNRRLIKPQGACGKLPYMSPEIYKNQTAFDGEAVDVFTAGTILFCMLSGNKSYERPEITDSQFYWMTHGLSQLLESWGVDLSREALKLLEGMLHISPKLRLSLDEVIDHPWFSFPDERPHIESQGFSFP